MLDVLPGILGFMMNFLSQIFDLYVSCSILAGFFTLWLLDRIFGIFDIIKYR